MNPFLYIFYHFYKLIVRVSLWAFYRKTVVLNPEGAKAEGPCILVSNHPSTVLDPLNVAVHVPRVVHFLANASLFKTRFTDWFFNTFFCIPIERYQDTGGRPLNNAASFERAIQFLSGGGCLYIAPEGNSFVQRRIRKVKTGMARIALNTEAENGWKLGLRIIPAGLNYEDPTQFRSSLVTLFGEPIRVADFQRDWETDDVAAVQNLTAHLSERLAALLLDPADEKEEDLLSQMETLLQNEQPLPPGQHFRRMQAVLGKLKSFRAEQCRYLEEKLSKLPPDLPVGYPPKWGTVLLLLTFPVFLLGYLTHFLPLFLTKKLSALLNSDLHWVPTYKYLIGLILYPLLLAGQVWLVSKLPGHWPTWAYLASIVPAGLVAERWLESWSARRREVSERKFAAQNAKEFAERQKLRADVLAMLER